MPSAKTRNGKTSKPSSHRTTSVRRRAVKKAATGNLKKRPIPPPSPRRAPVVRLPYEPRELIAYYPDKVRIVSLRCSQPVLSAAHPDVFVVALTMEVRNLTPEILRNVECRMYVHERFTIAVEHVTLQGNATTTVSGQFANRLDGGYTVTAVVSPGVAESYMGRFNNFMTREFDITHTSSRQRREDSTLRRVVFV